MHNVSEGLKLESPPVEDPCMICGKQSEVGAHVIVDGVVIDEDYCEECYGKRKRGTQN